MIRRLKPPMSLPCPLYVRNYFCLFCSFISLMGFVSVINYRSFMEDMKQNMEEKLPIHTTRTTSNGLMDNETRPKVTAAFLDTHKKSDPKHKQSSTKLNAHRIPEKVKKRPSTKKSDVYEDMGGSLPLRLCRIKIDPGQKYFTRTNEPIGVLYQCAGPDYDDFSTKLLELASNPEKYGKDSKNWGRRSTPMPPNSSVLFLGNSHTRQVFQSLMCQYEFDIINATHRSDLDGKGNGIWDVRLKKNITVYGVFNVPHVYSSRWPELLKTSLNIPSFDNMDAVVLGHFNTFVESKNSAFLLMMKNLTAGTDADFEGIGPPEIDEIAKIYAGPILAVSMFAEYGVHRFQKVLQNIKMLQKDGRLNISPISGRQYIPYLGECASDVGEFIGTCLIANKTNGERHKNGHRCVGKNGGHPDLLSWDIVEELYRHMKMKNLIYGQKKQ